MMRSFLGPENFRAAVSAYFREFYMRSAGIEELVDVYSRYKESGFLVGWVTQPGYPVLILEDDGVIHQAPASGVATDDSLNWTVPVDVRYSIGGVVGETQLLVGAEPIHLEIDVEWACVNFRLETLCRVWHKGRFHRGIVEAIRRRKLPRPVVLRVVDDISWAVSVGIAPLSMLEGLITQPTQMSSGRMAEGRLARFAINE
jgi:hypothetical protein